MEGGEVEVVVVREGHGQWRVVRELCVDLVEEEARRLDAAHKVKGR